MSTSSSPSMSDIISNNTGMNNTRTESSILADNNKYETAKQFAKRAVEIFDSVLKPYKTKQNSLAAGQVEKYLVELKNAVDNKAPPLDIMTIVHTKIHPNLQLAYNLKTRTS
jgi:hypothetical protein